MDSKIAFDERINFADRLRSALERAGQPTEPSSFARAYNLRADGASVTAHGARKWLKGEAIPTHEKLIIIARWLRVHASWLRFGDAENGTYDDLGQESDALSAEHLVLVNDIRTLTPAGQAIVRDLVDSLLRVTSDERRKLDTLLSKKSLTGRVARRD